MYFQRRCVGDTTAVYTLRNDGAVGVRNRRRTPDGFDEASARARSATPVTWEPRRASSRGPR